MSLFCLVRPRFTSLLVAALLTTLTSLAYAGNVVGYVISRSGVGIAGASVTIAGGITVSDTTGRYTFSALPAGPQTVTAGAGYYSANSVRVTVPQTGTATAPTIVLSSYLGTVRGYITDATTNKVIAGAKISVVGGTASATTNGTGSYNLPGVWNGSQTLTVTAPGYLPTSGVITVVADSIVYLNFGMKTTWGQISGIVTDAKTGKPLAGATVALSGGNVTTISSATGAYVLSGVAAGTYNVTVSQTGYKPANSTATVAVGKPATANIALSPGLQVVVITGVQANTDSVKVTFTPVPGAQDYRIYAVSDPMTVKYAGTWHLDSDYMQQFLVDSSGAPLLPVQETSNGAISGPTHIDIPATEIEWNGLQPGQATRLIVEAVDSLGPFPDCNVATDQNTPACPCPGVMCMLGSNAGMTQDGNTSINGQGNPNILPNVIARSASFVVQATGITALPSGSDATQVFFDTFASGQITPVGSVDPVNGIMQFEMSTTAGNWDIVTKKVDTNVTMPMLDRGHLMDVLYDGGTPNTNNPLHQSHASLAFSPQQTFDFSNGQILHVTMEIDSHTDNRRWAGIDLAPAADPLFDWYSTEAQINNSDQAIMTHIYKDHPTLDALYGPFSSTWNLPNGDPVMGSAGQAFNTPMRPKQGFQYGHGLDDRSRFDLFISQTHFIWFEDGIDVCEADIPRGVPFSNAKVYFTHYVYHTDNEVAELLAGASYETDWLNNVPYSDERHWDNLGIEVLPATTRWSSLWSRVQLPATTPPVY